MTRPERPELRTPAGTPETPRTRVIRSIGDSTELDAGYLAALVYIGDQLGRIADDLPARLEHLDHLGRLADDLPGTLHEAFHHLDQLTKSTADIAHAVERLHPSEDPHE